MTTQPLSEKKINNDFVIRYFNQPIYQEGFLKQAIQKTLKELKEQIWKHPNCFEGIKCKTCLPLDYVDKIIDTTFKQKFGGLAQ